MKERDREDQKTDNSIGGAIDGPTGDVAFNDLKNTTIGQPESDFFAVRHHH